MRLWLFLLIYMYGNQAWSDESIRVCYGYGCLVEAEVIISENRMQQIAQRLVVAVDAVGEREMLSEVIGVIYAWGGEQTPIHHDRGGNYADEGVSGAMDCIDHSISTTRILKVLERRGWLRWHMVIASEIRRTLYVFEHHAAAIEEKIMPAEGEVQRFVVDSWFVDNGKPAVILPLKDWKKGAGPDV